MALENNAIDGIEVIPLEGGVTSTETTTTTATTPKKQAETTTAPTYNPSAVPYDSALIGQENAQNVGKESYEQSREHNKELQSEIEDWAQNQEDYDRPINDILEEDAVNTKNRADTLALSRLADALNSRDWSYWQGGAVNARGDGTNTQGGLKDINVSDVSTAESRAQDIAETLSKSKSEKTLNRQDILKQMPIINEKFLKELEGTYGVETSRLMLSTFSQALSILLDEHQTRWSDDERLRYAKTVADAIISTKDERLRGLLMLTLNNSNLYSNVQDYYNRYAQQILENLNNATTLEEKSKYAKQLENLYETTTNIDLLQTKAQVDAAKENAKELLKGNKEEE